MVVIDVDVVVVVFFGWPITELETPLTKVAKVQSGFFSVRFTRRRQHSDEQAAKQSMPTIWVSR